MFNVAAKAEELKAQAIKDKKQRVRELFSISQTLADRGEYYRATGYALEARRLLKDVEDIEKSDALEYVRVKIPNLLVNEADKYMNKRAELLHIALYDLAVGISNDVDYIKTFIFKMNSDLEHIVHLVGEFEAAELSLRVKNLVEYANEVLAEVAN